MTNGERIGRFSNGQEALDITPAHERIGRFSDGQATIQDHSEHATIGRFSTGQELLAETPEHVRVGRFSDREVARPSLTLLREARIVDRVERETVGP